MVWAAVTAILKSDGTKDGLLFSVPMKCVQTGFTNKYFKLDQVDSEIIHPDVLCSDSA